MRGDQIKIEPHLDAALRTILDSGESSKDETIIRLRLENERLREAARLALKRLRSLLRETIPYIEGAQNTTNMEAFNEAALLICAIHTAAPIVSQDSSLPGGTKP